MKLSSVIACWVFRLLLHVIGVVPIRCFSNSNYDFQEQGNETGFVQVLVFFFIYSLELEEKILSGDG